MYAYAYGHLLALSVYRRYEQEGEGFVASYLELLQAPAARGRPRSWGRSSAWTCPTRASGAPGLDLIERQLEAAERAAEEAGRTA